jgi:hypothetical protein
VLDKAAAELRPVEVQAARAARTESMARQAAADGS